MKKNNNIEEPFDLDGVSFEDDADILDDFDPFDDETPSKENNCSESDNWTIVTALNRVAQKASRSKLADTFWVETEKSRAFLRESLNLSDMQVLFIAILTEQGDSMSWSHISRYIGCPRLELLCHAEEMDNLLKRRWVQQKRDHYRNTPTYELARGVVDALSHNQPFQPEVLSGMNEQTLVERLQFLMRNATNRNMDTTGNEVKNMIEIVEANPELPLCKKILAYIQNFGELTGVVLMMTAIDYSAFAGSEDEGLELDYLDRAMPNEWEYHSLRKSLCRGNHILMRDGLIEHKCVDGIADTECFVLTDEAKESLLPEFTEDYKTEAPQPMPRNLKSHTSIPQKTLFFNPKEKEQIKRLADLLEPDNLSEVQRRLSEKNMRQGFSCLFYGAPGTGKTETVYQLARTTGRDIMEVNIAGMRDKFVGESEKNIKAVFNRYRKVCRQCDMMPILFFNEADAIINKRTENVERSVDKMDNAMQNIILQELENLDGILIATTNLVSNLDSAFDRRFLFKVEFKKPTVEVKAKIWNYMLDDLSQEDAESLASKYDFSGGQIENISRKQNIDYILTGEKPSLDRLESYCKEEVLEKKGTRASIGFKTK